LPRFSWAFVYLVINFKEKSAFSIPNVIFFWSLLGFAGLMLFASIAFVAYALLREFRYARIPPPQEILSYCQNHPRPATALDKAKAFLLGRYVAAVEHNE